jgi:hypothetical protein
VRVQGVRDRGAEEVLAAAGHGAGADWGDGQERLGGQYGARAGGGCRRSARAERLRIWEGYARSHIEGCCMTSSFPVYWGGESVSGISCCNFRLDAVVHICIK